MAERKKRCEVKLKTFDMKRARILISILVLFIMPLPWLGGCMWRDFTGSDTPTPDGLQTLTTPQLTNLRQELIDYLQSKGIMFVTRKDWGAKDSTVPAQNITAIKGIVIHHSASSNTAQDWSKEVQRIQRDHMRQGWEDIGYNFLIDPNGKIYEGRITKDGFGIGFSNGQFFAVIGAHTAAESLNNKAIGINFLGCYQNAQEQADAKPGDKCSTGSPTPEALNAAKVLIEWLAAKIGKVSCFIIAHRDVELGKPHCPGWNVYVKLPEFREVAGVGNNVSLSATSFRFPAEGGNETITVTSTHWWQVYRGVDWIEIKQPPGYRFKSSYLPIRAIGYGNGSVIIMVKPNQSPQKRVGSVVIGGVLVVIEQQGKEKVATPKFDPAPGEFQGMIWVSISCATPEATIRYTTDGNKPTEKSPQYTEPILIARTTTLKARAFKSGLSPSDVATATYVIRIPTFLTQFWIFVHNTQVKKGWNWLELPDKGKNKIIKITTAKYMRIEEIEPGKKWRIGFEDLTEEVNESVDWDYDEPLLEIELLNPQTRELLVRGLRITGVYRHDLGFGNQYVYKDLGGGDVFDFGTWRVKY